MSILLDALLAGIVLISAIAGARRGFFRTIVSMAGGIVALFCAITFSQPLSDWLYARFFFPYVQRGASEALSNLIGSSLNESELLAILDRQPSALLELLSRYSSTLEDIRQICTENLADGYTALVSRISDFLAQSAALTLAGVCAFCIIFFGIRLGLWLIASIMTVICRLPVLSGLNRFGGFLAGLAVGCAYAFIAALLLNQAAPAIHAVFPAVDADFAEKSHLLRVIVENSGLESEPSGEPIESQKSSFYYIPS